MRPTKPCAILFVHEPQRRVFSWFVGLAMDVRVWDVTVFTKNWDRLLEGDVACGFLTAMLADPAVKPLLSTEHFSVVDIHGLATMPTTSVHWA